MVQFNLRQRELTLKVVYYGPGLSGKTTNLQALHRWHPGDSRTADDPGNQGRPNALLRSASHGLEDRQWLSHQIEVIHGPWPDIHTSTRRLVLQGADAMLVADSQVAETEANKQSYADLLRNLDANGLSIQMPLVVQFNKRDLPDIRTEEELAAFQKRRNHPVIPAIAVEGQGVKETLGSVEQLWSHLETTYVISEKLKTTEREFLDGFFTGWNGSEASQ